MKIQFQNPTQGPLITVSFEETDGAQHAFVPAAVDCGTKLFGQGSITSSGGAASVAGPLALVGMLFAAGDSSKQEPNPSPIQPTLSPDQLRCLSNPYDMSAACAAVRSQSAQLPLTDNSLDSNAARAIMGDPRIQRPIEDPALNLPSTISETSANVAAILETTPSVAGPWNMGWSYMPELVASGTTLFPRLEALVALLVGDKASPHIIERGPGTYTALAITLARRYRVTVIEKTKEHPPPNFSGVPAEIHANITLLDVSQAPATPTADLAIWIHPIPHLMKDDDDILDLAFMGQDVVPGGYLVIQTEVQYYGIHPDPDWEVIHDAGHIGFLAPSRFSNFSSRTIVLRRKPTLLPSDWHELAQTNSSAFAVRVRAVVTAIITDLWARIDRGEPVTIIAAWYERTAVPQLELMSTAFKTHFPKRYNERRDRLARDLMLMNYTIPVLLEAGDLRHAILKLHEVGK